MNELINYQQLAENWLNNQNKKLTPQQVEEFIMFCKMYKLNPWLKEAYAIPFNGQLQLVTNYLVLCARAKQNPKYYREVIEYWQNGEKLNHPHLTPNMRGVVICVNIYDKNSTLISNYDFDVDENAAANKGSFKNNYYNSWAEKCAITNALRRTFPNEVAGLYIPEEFNAEIESVSVTDGNKHPNISTVFKDTYNEIKKIVKDRKIRSKLITEYCTAKKITDEDLSNGNFEPTDLMEFIKASPEVADSMEDETTNKLLETQVELFNSIGKEKK